MELTQEQARLAQIYLDKLESTNLISKNEVLSIEDSLGANLLTSVRSVDYYTSDPSAVGVSLVKKILQDSIKSIKASRVRTPLEMAHDFGYIKERINHLIKDLDYCFKIKPEVLQAMSSERLTTIVKENTREANDEMSIIGSMLDYDLIYVFTTYPMFLKQITDICGNELKSNKILDSMYSKILTDDDNLTPNMSFYNDYNFIVSLHNSGIKTYQDLLDTTKPFKLSHPSATLQDLLDFINNAGAYQSTLATLSLSLEKYNPYSDIRSKIYFNTIPITGDTCVETNANLIRNVLNHEEENLIEFICDLSKI